MLENRLYHVLADDGNQYGPITEPELRTWIREGRVQRHNQIWWEGSPEWESLGEHPLFQNSFVPPANVARPVKVVQRPDYNAKNRGNKSAKQHKSSVFRPIACRADAVHIVRQLAGFCFMAATLGILGGFSGDTTSFFSAGGAALCGFLLWIWQSRIVAVIQLIGNSIFGVVLLFQFLASNGEWRQNASDTAIVLILGGGLYLLLLFLCIRAVEATFKVHGIYADEND